jgi:AraC-like DNA-binding protein
MGIHKYRIYKRLQLAIRLLDEGKSVKETAAKTGWRSADLIDAYQNVYGTTPGAARKKA